MLPSKTKTPGKLQQALLTALLTTLALTGCNEKNGEKPATQIAAKVNGTEISTHQLNHLLTKAGNIPADKVDLARKSVLDRLIEQELFAAKAIEDKLDRSPETLIALDMARKEVLARAYLEQVLAAGEKIGNNEIAKYYLLHPELFSERKVYNLQEITFAIGAMKPEEIQALIKQAKSLDQIEENLRKQNIEIRKNAAIRPAEQLPLEFLKQLHQAKDGEILLINGSNEYNVLRIIATRQVPVTELQATPAIQQFLVAKRNNELKEKQLKALKEKAKIDYMGSFAEAAGQAPAAATAK